MYIPQKTIKVLRYLCVWRVNSSLARMPTRFNLDLTHILAQLITDKLSTRLARPWKKLLSAYEQSRTDGTFTEKLWPLDVAISAYPTKSTFNQGEVICFEIKLFGEEASHDTFLELILPAMEDAGLRRDGRWYYKNGLWGHFDIDAVYVCKGDTWQPLVIDGELDLHYKPTPWQWADTHTERITQKVQQQTYKHLHWLTSFDLSLSDETLLASVEEPWGRSLRRVIEAMIARMDYLLEISKNSELSIWDFFEKHEVDELEYSLNRSDEIIHGRHDIAPARRDIPGQWQGIQHFPEAIPAFFVPYLDVASILHIGRFTQYGCGSFILK